MICTESWWIPSIAVSAVTTTADIPFKKDLMSFMVSFLKALLANNAGWIFFASYTFPCHVSWAESLCANCWCSSFFLNVLDDFMVVRGAKYQSAYESFYIHREFGLSLMFFEFFIGLLELGLNYVLDFIRVVSSHTQVSHYFLIFWEIRFNWSGFLHFLINK